MGENLVVGGSPHKCIFVVLYTNVTITALRNKISMTYDASNKTGCCRISVNLAFWRSQIIIPDFFCIYFKHYMVVMK